MSVGIITWMNYHNQKAHPECDTDDYVRVSVVLAVSKHLAKT